MRKLNYNLLQSTVRKALEKDPREKIDLAEYLKLAQSFGINEKDAKQVSFASFSEISLSLLSQTVVTVFLVVNSVLLSVVDVLS